MSGILEKTLEQFFHTSAHARGWLPVKVMPFGIIGFPDRLLFAPGGRLFIIELKAPGKKPGKMQTMMHGKLRALGFNVQVLDSKKSVTSFFENIEKQVRHEGNL